jgi:hypothetical protein
MFIFLGVLCVLGGEILTTTGNIRDNHAHTVRGGARAQTKLAAHNAVHGTPDRMDTRQRVELWS